MHLVLDKQGWAQEKEKKSWSQDMTGQGGAPPWSWRKYNIFHPENAISGPFNPYIARPLHKCYPQIKTKIVKV